MKINGEEVDILEMVNLDKRKMRMKTYYNPPESFAEYLDEETALNSVRITFEKISELDRFIKDMIGLRESALRKKDKE